MNSIVEKDDVLFRTVRHKDGQSKELLVVPSIPRSEIPRAAHDDFKNVGFLSVSAVW